MRHSSHLHLHFHTHHRAARYDVDMTKGSITKHLINFALPLMVGNLFQQLYNMVDTWVVGNYVSNEAFSAVGTVTPIINTLIGFFLGLSSGAGVVISQYYGAGREDKVRQAVHTSLVLTLLMGAVFTAAGIAMTPLMLRLMKTPAEVAPEQPPTWPSTSPASWDCCSTTWAPVSSAPWAIPAAPSTSCWCPPC